MDNVQNCDSYSSSLMLYIDFSGRDNMNMIKQLTM
jgi:hypothetical protein